MKIGIILRLQGDWICAVLEVIQINSRRSCFHSHVLCCTTLSCAHCLAQVWCPVSPPRDETSEPGRDHPLCNAVGVSQGGSWLSNIDTDSFASLPSFGTSYKNNSASPAWRKTKPVNDRNWCEWMTTCTECVMWQRHAPRKRCSTCSALALWHNPLQHVQMVSWEMNNSNSGNSVRKQLDYIHDSITTKSLLLMCAVVFCF